MQQAMPEPEYEREKWEYLQAQWYHSRSEQAEKAQPELDLESQPESLDTPPTFTSKKITTVLLKMLRAAFDDEELTTLCFEHFRHVYDKFASGTGRLVKIRLLVEYCERYGEVNELLNLIKEQNPHQYYEHILGSLNVDPQPPKEEIGYDRSKVEIILLFSWSSFTLELKFAVIGALADALNIFSNYIKVLDVRAGSVILYLEMPEQAVNQLVAWYRTGDPMIKDLGIQRVQEIDQIPAKHTTHISHRINERPQTIRSDEYLLGKRLLIDIIKFSIGFYWKTLREAIHKIWIKLWN